MNKPVIPFQSLSRELKSIITNKLSTYEELESELKKLKYSNAMKKSAKYHFRQSREMLDIR